MFRPLVLCAPAAAQPPGGAKTEKGFVWGLKAPQRGVDMRYTMALTPKGEWHEVGEYTLDGKAWTKFIEMTLTRLKEKP